MRTKGLATIAVAALVVAVAFAARRHLREEAEWRRAKATGDSSESEFDYAQYLGHYPSGRHAAEAREVVAWIRARLGPPSDTRAYLSSYPSGRHATEAAAAAALPVLDIVEAERRGMVEVVAEGARYGLTILVRRKSPPGLWVQIEPGIVLRSRDPSIEDLVLFDSMTLNLAYRSTWRLGGHAVSASLRGRTLRGSDSLAASVRPTLPGPELRRLTSALGPTVRNDPSGVPSGAQQAAVWIVTDDASYGDLGILQRITHGTLATLGLQTRARAIAAADVVEALLICANAGIDIRRKDIWHDRAELAAELAERQAGDSDTLRALLRSLERRR